MSQENVENSERGWAMFKRLVLSERTVEAHVRSVLMKLSIPESGEAHRRVLAVLAHLTAAHTRW